MEIAKTIFTAIFQLLNIVFIIGSICSLLFGGKITEGFKRKRCKVRQYRENIGRNQ